MIWALPIGRASGVDIAVPVNLKAEILAMLAAGRAGADIARIFRVHHATISRIATEARRIGDRVPDYFVLAKSMR